MTETESEKDQLSTEPYVTAKPFDPLRALTNCARRLTLSGSVPKVPSPAELLISSAYLRSLPIVLDSMGRVHFHALLQVWGIEFFVSMI